MDKSKVVLVGLLLLLPSTTFARIGETLTQCEARYGKADRTDKDTGVVYFLKGGFYIMVDFHQGKAEAVGYKKEQGGKEMSDNEIETLLKANGEDKKWKRIESITIKQQWRTEDGLLVAVYYPVDNILLVGTQEGLARFRTEKKAKEDKKLEGF